MTSSANPEGPRLCALRDKAEIGEWPLDASRPLKIGRSRQCDVVLDDDAISREHLEIRPIAGTWEAVDLGSRGGTWLRGKRVTQQRLRSGDRLVVGHTELLAVDLDGPEAPPPLPARPGPPPLPPPATYPARSPSGRASRAVVWSAVALVAGTTVVAGGWFAARRLLSRAPSSPSVAGKTRTPALYSEVAARALLEPSTDGTARKTPLGSFTATAAGGRLDHPEITVEVPAGAVPEGTRVAVFRVDAAPVAMRESFPIARLGDFTPLSAILALEPTAPAPVRPATVSFPLASGTRFTSLTVVTWNPEDDTWDSFPARFDPASGKTVAEVGHFRILHLLGLAEGVESRDEGAAGEAPAVSPSE